MYISFNTFQINGDGDIAKDILSVYKVNQHGTLAITIPIGIAGELGLNENSLVKVSKEGNAILYTPLKVSVGV